MDKILQIGCLCLFFFSTLTSHAQSSLVEISPQKDNTLYENASGALSNGAGEFLFAGTTAGNQTRRGLLAFDISAAVPAGAIIDSVFLTLHASRTISGSQAVELHKVLQNWGEGASQAGGNEGGGGQAMSGDATWLHTFYDNALWNTAGGDFSNIASASQAISDTGFYTWNNTEALTADVQGWMDDPANNFGWLILNDEENAQTAKRFDSRENVNESFRPNLQIYYSTPTGISIADENIPARFNLYQNFPNPFNPTTEIQFTLSRAGHTVFTVYDMNGKKVAELLNESLAAGTHTVTFNANHLSSGLYLYALSFRGEKQIRKMVYLR